tara:strand:- start:1996 stop:2193 length:198 start_codon:yes stop_codon:yes gene_type:complete
MVREFYLYMGSSQPIHLIIMRILNAQEYRLLTETVLNSVQYINQNNKDQLNSILDKLYNGEVTDE